MKKILKKGKRGNRKARLVVYEEMKSLNDSSTRIELIQMLIPVGLQAIEEELQLEVMRIAGARYTRTDPDLKRWGCNEGSVFLGDQKVAIAVPRVRDVSQGKEVPLSSYRDFQNPRGIDEVVFKRLINGISTRKYEKAALDVPATFGIKKSSVSRKFIRASARKLKECLERDLSGYDIVSIFIDGKGFAENEVIVALGVTLEGKKVILGFIESSTENAQVCRDFMNELINRGLNTDNEILFVIDGAKGIHKGIKSALSKKAVIQRCQWHKRENILKYLDKSHQSNFRRKLQSAYEQPTYEAAKKKLNLIKRELAILNQSAVRSLEEGMEETLTLHRLGMFPKLGISLKTTNCIENIMRQVGIYTDRVSYWKNSDQRQRWVGTALQEIEPKLRIVRGYRHLKELREAMKNLNFKENIIKVA
ncbi:MAG TPA: IS256 family transposase [Candidatus Marinimicrobia bacterium]|jgi:transposase-like protein|nr:IS256 family transposase [Candidatus Neomarinimicrobiota bacterium]